MNGAKFALLLVAGGIAGAAFAALTTGALPRFTNPDRNRAILSDAPPTQRSWLDEGLSALNSPAWPFGRGPHDDGGNGWRDDSPSLPPGPPQDYAPYGYGPSDDYDDGAWERHQYGNHAPYREQGYPSADSEAAQLPAPIPVVPRADAADDAAARAADAAQDVMSAENAP